MVIRWGKSNISRFVWKWKGCQWFWPLRGDAICNRKFLSKYHFSLQKTDLDSNSKSRICIFLFNMNILFDDKSKHTFTFTQRELDEFFCVLWPRSSMMQSLASTSTQSNLTLLPNFNWTPDNFTSLYVSFEFSSSYPLCLSPPPPARIIKLNYIFISAKTKSALNFAAQPFSIYENKQASMPFQNKK